MSDNSTLDSNQNPELYDSGSFEGSQLRAGSKLHAESEESEGQSQPSPQVRDSGTKPRQASGGGETSVEVGPLPEISGKPEVKPAAGASDSPDNSPSAPESVLPQVVPAGRKPEPGSPASESHEKDESIRPQGAGSLIAGTMQAAASAVPGKLDGNVSPETGPQQQARPAAAPHQGDKPELGNGDGTVLQRPASNGSNVAPPASPIPSSVRHGEKQEEVPAASGQVANTLLPATRSALNNAQTTALGMIAGIAPSVKPAESQPAPDRRRPTPGESGTVDAVPPPVPSTGEPRPTQAPAHRPIVSGSNDDRVVTTTPTLSNAADNLRTILNGQNGAPSPVNPRDGIKIISSPERGEQGQIPSPTPVINRPDNTGTGSQAPAALSQLLASGMTPIVQPAENRQQIIASGGQAAQTLLQALRPEQGRPASESPQSQTEPQSAPLADLLRNKLEEPQPPTPSRLIEMMASRLPEQILSASRMPSERVVAAETRVPDLVKVSTNQDISQPAGRRDSQAVQLDNVDNAKVTTGTIQGTFDPSRVPQIDGRTAPQADSPQQDRLLHFQRHSQNVEGLAMLAPGQKGALSPAELVRSGQPEAMKLQELLGQAGKLEGRLDGKHPLIDLKALKPEGAQGLAGKPQEMPGLPGTPGAKVADAQAAKSLILDPSLMSAKPEGENRTGKGEIAPATRGAVTPQDLIPQGKPVSGELIPGTGKPLEPLPPGAKPQDRKDIIDKTSKDDDKPQNKEILDAMLVASTRKGVKDKVKDTKETAPDRKIDKRKVEVRRRYVVKYGDTVESIASTELGDERFSVLICIINRATIRFAWQGAVRTAELRAGQVLWLPTSTELSVHRAMFFTDRNKKSSSDSGSALSHEPATSATSTAEITEEIPLPELEIESDKARYASSDDQDETIIVDARQTSVTAVLYALRRAGGRSSITIDLQIPERQTRHRLLEKMAEVVSHATEFEKPVITSRPDTLTGVQKYDGSCRLMRVDRSGIDEFSTQLQMKTDSGWVTIASYDFKGGYGMRRVWTKTGASQSFSLRLPTSIIKQMAIEDFNRYWQTYVQNFICPEGKGLPVSKVS